MPEYVLCVCVWGGGGGGGIVTGQKQPLWNVWCKTRLFLNRRPIQSALQSVQWCNSGTSTMVAYRVLSLDLSGGSPWPIVNVPASAVKPCLAYWVSFGFAVLWLVVCLWYLYLQSWCSHYLPVARTRVLGLCTAVWGDVCAGHMCVCDNAVSRPRLRTRWSPVSALKNWIRSLS